MCAKFKYILYDMIELPNYDDIIPFEKKCLYVGLPLSSKISKNDKKTTFRNSDLFLSKLHLSCPENVFNNIINNHQKPYLQELQS